MGSRKLDNLDVCMIPFLYFFRMNLTLLSLAIIINSFNSTHINQYADIATYILYLYFLAIF